MNHSRSYPNVIRRWYRPVEHECPQCGRTLREAVALSRRTVITLGGVIKLNHAGYRCPDPQCVGHARTYRSVQADALALPHFTYGLDIVLLVGRVLTAENVTSSETAVMKALLAPVVALGVKVLGTITDAQESELLAVQELWPQVPHQVCQFHALRDASQRAFEADKQVKTALRKHMQPKVREVRKQLKKQIPKASAEEARQLAVLDEYV